MRSHGSSSAFDPDFQAVEARILPVIAAGMAAPEIAGAVPACAGASHRSPRARPPRARSPVRDYGGDPDRAPLAARTRQSGRHCVQTTRSVRAHGQTMSFSAATVASTASAEHGLSQSAVDIGHVFGAAHHELDGDDVVRGRRPHRLRARGDAPHAGGPDQAAEFPRVARGGSVQLPGRHHRPGIG